MKKQVLTTEQNLKELYDISLTRSLGIFWGTEPTSVPSIAYLVPLKKTS